MKMNERQSKSFPESEAEISGIGKESNIVRCIERGNSAGIRIELDENRKSREREREREKWRPWAGTVSRAAKLSHVKLGNVRPC